MIGLRELLLQEQARLETIVRRTEKQLRDVPQGTLRLSKSNGKIQYYHCRPDTRRNGEYLSTKNIELIQKLAQKSYDKKIFKLAGKRLKQIKKITNDYADDEIEKILLEEHYEKRKLIEPIEMPWEQQVEQWMSKTYTGKEFKNDTPVILTERGERVRSKSEKILADYFYHRGIQYKYEHPLYLKGYGTVYPDFTFLSKRTRKEIYWEHDGKMDDPAYAQNAVRKIQAYEDNDIYLGERLILTFETTKTVLDTRLIEKMICRYL